VVFSTLGTRLIPSFINNALFTGLVTEKKTVPTVEPSDACVPMQARSCTEDGVIIWLSPMGVFWLGYYGVCVGAVCWAEWGGGKGMGAWCRGVAVLGCRGCVFGFHMSSLGVSCGVYLYVLCGFLVYLP